MRKISDSFPGYSLCISGTLSELGRGKISNLLESESKTFRSLPKVVSKMILLIVLRLSEKFLPVVLHRKSSIIFPIVSLPASPRILFLTDAFPVNN